MMTNNPDIRIFKIHFLLLCFKLLSSMISLHKESYKSSNWAVHWPTYDSCVAGARHCSPHTGHVRRTAKRYIYTFHYCTWIYADHNRGRLGKETSYRYRQRDILNISIFSQRWLSVTETTRPYITTSFCINVSFNQIENFAFNSSLIFAQEHAKKVIVFALVICSLG